MLVLNLRELESGMPINAPTVTGKFIITVMHNSIFHCLPWLRNKNWFEIHLMTAAVTELLAAEM